MLQARECALTPSPSDVFTFGFEVESIKEFGGALKVITITIHDFFTRFFNQKNPKMTRVKKNQPINVDKLI